MNGIEKIESSGALSGFLATAMPEITGLDFAASLNPAQLVGGDYYGAHPVSDSLTMLDKDFTICESVDEAFETMQAE